MAHGKIEYVQFYNRITTGMSMEITVKSQKRLQMGKMCGAIDLKMCVFQLKQVCIYIRIDSRCFNCQSSIVSVSYEDIKCIIRISLKLPSFAVGEKSQKTHAALKLLAIYIPNILSLLSTVCVYTPNSIIQPTTQKICRVILYGLSLYSTIILQMKRT